MLAKKLKVNITENDYLKISDEDTIKDANSSDKNNSKSFQKGINFIKIFLDINLAKISVGLRTKFSKSKYSTNKSRTNASK